MNKKGQTTFGVALVISIMLFIVGMPVVNLLKPEIDTARAAAQLDCANTAISDGNKLACLAVDITIPFFILLIFSVAGGYILSRLLI